MADYNQFWGEDRPSPLSDQTDKNDAGNQNTDNPHATVIPSVPNIKQINDENSSQDCDIGVEDDETFHKNDHEPFGITYTTYISAHTGLSLPNNAEIPTNENEGNLPSSNSIEQHGMQQKCTTNENPVDVYQIKSVSLLNPLFTVLSDKTERSTDLKDYFGNVPVLIVNGCLPDDLEVKMAMVSTSSRGDYQSLYYFHDRHSEEFTYKLRRRTPFERIGNYNLIKLDALSVRKGKNYERIERENNGVKKLKCKKSPWYFLTPYPSGEKERVRAKGSTTFANRYNLKQARVAIQFFSGNSETPITINNAEDELTFFSNFIGTGPNVTERSDTAFTKVNITEITPYERRISFEDQNELHLQFQIECTENFADQLNSYPKWIEIEIFGNKPNSIYYLKDGHALTKLMRMKMTQTSLTVSLTIGKQTLSEDPDILDAMHVSSQNTATDGSLDHQINSIMMRMGWNKFCLQFRWFSIIMTDTDEQITPYTDALECQFGEYTEYLEQSTLSLVD